MERKEKFEKMMSGVRKFLGKFRREVDEKSEENSVRGEEILGKCGEEE